VKLTLRKPDDQVVEDADVATAVPVAHADSWTHGTSLTTRALAGALWALLACGPIALGAQMLAADPPATVTAESGPAPTEVAAAGESAVSAVRTWLTATRDAPDAVLSLYPALQSSALPKVAASVSASSVAALHLEAAGVWSVTVGVDVGWPDAEGQLSAATRLYFEVPIATAGDDGTAASPIALPAPVAAPAQVTGVQLRYQASLSTNSALGTTVGEFLAALLTGQGDVGRYITPGAAIASVTPAPFAAVELRRVWATDQIDPSAVPQDGATVQVLVDATLIPAAGSQLTTQYRFELTARAGRWEITQIQGNPAVRVDHDASASTTEGANP